MLAAGLGLLTAAFAPRIGKHLFERSPKPPVLSRGCYVIGFALLGLSWLVVGATAAVMRSAVPIMELILLTAGTIGIAEGKAFSQKWARADRVEPVDQYDRGTIAISAALFGAGLLVVGVRLYGMLLDN
jgi:hypothetical protein